MKPPPSPQVVGLVQSSWSTIRPISDAAATLFYERLFSLDPSLRKMFKTDMSAQKRKLMQTLNVAVDGLRHPGRLVPILREMGARHAGYMVNVAHYDTVGDALMWTLGEGLGEGFTPQIEAAWAETYGFIAEVMKEGASDLENDDATVMIPIQSVATNRPSRPAQAKPRRSPPTPPTPKPSTLANEASTGDAPEVGSADPPAQPSPPQPSPLQPSPPQPSPLQPINVDVRLCLPAGLEQLSPPGRGAELGIAFVCGIIVAIPALQLLTGLAAAVVPHAEPSLAVALLSLVAAVIVIAGLFLASRWSQS